MEEQGIAFATKMLSHQIRLDGARCVSEDLEDGETRGSIYFIVCEGGEIIPVPYDISQTKGTEEVWSYDDDGNPEPCGVFNGESLRDFTNKHTDKNPSFLIWQSLPSDGMDGGVSAIEFDIQTIEREQSDGSAYKEWCEYNNMIHVAHLGVGVDQITENTSELTVSILQYKQDIKTTID